MINLLLKKKKLFSFNIYVLSIIFNQLYLKSYTVDLINYKSFLLVLKKASYAKYQYALKMYMPITLSRFKIKKDRNSR